MSMGADENKLVQRDGSNVAETIIRRLRPLQELAALTATANGGRAVDFATMFRWSQRGRRGVRLRTARVGRRLCSTPEWLLEFFETLAAADDVGIAPVVAPAKRTRAFERRQEEADQILEDFGV